MTKKTIAIILVLATCVTVGIVAADYYRSSPQQLSATFIGRDSCVQCHRQQAIAFTGSHHDQAMQEANETTVLGDFSDQTLEHFGVVSRMYRDDSRFMINTQGPHGSYQDYEIQYTFGVYPLQQYMVTIEQESELADGEIGRLQVLRVSWDCQKKQWFYLSPPDVLEKLDPSDPLHWTGSTQNWNLTCATCHSTNFQKNFDVATASYHSTFSEIDVSCEACHGPGSYHLELANRTSLFWDRQHGLGLAKLKSNHNLDQINACAPCHSRRTEVENGFKPGCNFDRYFAIQTITEPTYHADGQIRDEDYVHGSFIQSKMFHQGIKCSDCHDVHSTRLIRSGNQVCTSCHQHPAVKYDTPQHHHHAPGAPGSACVDCHMPSTTYMEIDARRDHSFRVPDPALSLTTGTPNACTGCHIDTQKLAQHSSVIPLRQYRDWIDAARRGDQIVAEELVRINTKMNLAIESWYGDSPDPQRTTYYRDLARGLMVNKLSPSAAALKKSASILVRLANDPSAPSIVRASAIESLDGSTIMFDQSALDLLQHTDLKIVAAALSFLDRRIGTIIRSNPPNNRPITTVIRPLCGGLFESLDHETVRIRIAAARILTGIPSELLVDVIDGRKQLKLDRAIAEFQASLMLTNDSGMAHTLLGSFLDQQSEKLDQALYANRSQPTAATIAQRRQLLTSAEQSYRNAIRIDPHVAGPRGNLAATLEAKARMLGQPPSKEITALRQQEHQLIKKDVQRSANTPHSHPVHFRYAMSCYLQGEYDTMEEHLNIAIQQAPDNETYLSALKEYYLFAKKIDKANAVNQRLKKLRSNTAVDTSNAP